MRTQTKAKKQEHSYENLTLALRIPCALICDKDLKTKPFRGNRTRTHCDNDMISLSIATKQEHDNDDDVFPVL